MDAGSASNVPAAPKHSPAFRRRRAYNWLTLGFTYAVMYSGRYNFSFANGGLSETFGWSKTQIGWIITGGKLIYGLAAFLNGMIADRIGGRKAMLIGSTGAFIFNLAFGLGAYAGMLGKGDLLLAYFVGVWSLNMYFQSYSAMSLVKVNSAWFHVGERGVFSAIFGMIIQFGRLLIMVVIGPLVVAYLPWQWVFFVPSGLIAAMAVASYFVVQNSPEEAGQIPLDTADATSGHTGPVDLAYLLKVIFTNPVTLTIAAAEFCTGFVRGSFEEWFPRYMTEAQHLKLDSPIFKSGALGVVLAGVAGAFAAGTISDWLFKARRAPVAVIGYGLQVVALGIVWRAPGLAWVIGAFVLNSFAISMVHSMLTGTASMDFGGKKAAATAAGLFDGMQYLGGALVGSGMGFLLDRFGWGAWGPSMIGFSALGGVLMVTRWNARPKSHGSAPPASGASLAVPAAKP